MRSSLNVNIVVIYHTDIVSNIYVYIYSVKNASDIYVLLNLTCKLQLDFISEISVKKLDKNLVYSQ